MLFAKDTTAVIVPAGGWRKTRNLSTARANLVEVRGLDGLVIVAPGIQLCNDPHSPDNSATTLKLAGGDTNGFANANGVYDPHSDGLISISAGSRLLWRPVWIVKLSSGNTLGHIYVSGSIEAVFNGG